MDISFFAHDLNVIFTGGVFGTTALADNITKLDKGFEFLLPNQYRGR